MSKIPAEFWESAAGRELAATLQKTAHDQVATLNDRLCPDKIF